MRRLYNPNAFGAPVGGGEEDPRVSQAAVWTVSSTGATGERALRDEAGDDIEHGDIGILGDGLQLYAVLDDDRRVAWIPRFLQSGVRLGETHTAHSIVICYEEDPSAHDGLTVVTGAAGVVDYDTTVAGKIAVRGGSALNTTITADATPPADKFGYLMGFLGSRYTQINGTQSIFELTADIGGTQEATFVYAQSPGSDYEWQQQGTNPVMTAVEFDATADLVFGRWDATSNTNRRAYENWPAPAQDGATPTATNEQLSGSLNTSFARFQILVRGAASSPAHFECDGFWAVYLEAV